jgi:hypothetical protein
LATKTLCRPGGPLAGCELRTDSYRLPIALAGVAGVEDEIVFGDADYWTLANAVVPLGRIQACARDEVGNYTEMSANF